MVLTGLLVNKKHNKVKDYVVNIEKNETNKIWKKGNYGSINIAFEKSC